MFIYIHTNTQIYVDVYTYKHIPIYSYALTFLIGKNRHMGENAGIMGLLTSTAMSDRDILQVINPSAADRNRSDKLDSASTDIGTKMGEISLAANRERAVTNPGHADWRNTPTIGKRLNFDTQVVRSNHFRIDPKGIVASMHQYVVHLYRFDRTGKEDTTDCAGERYGSLL